MNKTSNLLFKEQLDQMAQYVAIHGCQRETCEHKSHEPLIFLRSRCHDAHVDILYKNDNVLEVSCCECGLLMCRLAVEKPKAITRCHINAPLELSYRLNDGFINLICHECDTTLGRITVRGLQ